MTPDACPEWRHDLAAFATGQIDDARAIALRAHLDGCAVCRADLGDLTEMAGLVSLADVDRVAAAIEPSADLGARISSQIAAERARRSSVRRRRWLATGIAAAAAAAAAVVVSVVAIGGDTPRPRGEQVVFTVAPRGVEAAAVLRSLGDGTAITLTATGLEPGAVYALWLAEPEGRRVAAGTFQPDDDGEVDVELLCALSRDAANRVWATGPDGDLVLDVFLS